ncbi:MAG TPA: FAD/NAD(P)-binding protein [Candidatus Corynebacterium avicola]|uniref:FAD/NAD(P)-binding protein n=1 Tax=Candidatus Corynebacterium avicola TaxID=2838527 RepID=A0A9D1UKX9_9CORY|nr:FAD/NAD(P)-binding protein [Candidatus Corynebacterium avicola]
MNRMPTLAIIGGGPRGISVLERIVAAASTLPADMSLDVHLVDDTEPGAGRVWRTDQTRTLCMNTMADAVTLFTEPGSTVSLPVLNGPTMYEWIQLHRGESLDATADPDGAKSDLVAAHPAELPESYAAEVAATVPQSHPSRALYGEYLRWVLSVVLDRATTQVTVDVHTATATEISGTDSADGTDGADRIVLSTGEEILADATVLALGWTDTADDAMEAFTALSVSMYSELTWVRPGNPADQDVSAIPSYTDSGEEVIVRGLGMGFFDLLAMLTIDRGGRFVPDPEARSGLAYEPSGAEPHLLVASHHGYPYQPKPVYDSLPPAASMPRFVAAKAAVPQDAPANSVDFDESLWPAILRDAQEAYYRVLLDEQQNVLEQVIALIDAPDSDPWTLHTDARLDGMVSPENRFDLPFHADPVARFAAADPTIDELTTAIADSVAVDLAEARRGRESALKAGLQIIGSARKPAAIVDQPNRFTTASRRSGLAELKRVGQMVGSGPPAFRTAELLCLVDAGYVRFLGGHPTVLIDPEAPAFLASSPSSGEEHVSSTTLVDAWLHKPDARSSSDPLTASLRASGRMRSWERGDGSTTKAPEVDLVTTRLVGESDEVDPRVHMIGIPLQEVRADMTISPMPRTDPLMLQETDAAAASALRVVQGLKV